MDRESMSNEENYCFDVAGYLIVRGVPGQRRDCSAEFGDRYRRGIAGHIGVASPAARTVS